jgi:hypothetical protein
MFTAYQSNLDASPSFPTRVSSHCVKEVAEKSQEFACLDPRASFHLHLSNRGEVILPLGLSKADATSLVCRSYHKIPDD